MSRTQPPAPAKLIIGLLLKEKTLIEEVVPTLTNRFGGMDMLSPWFSFHYTDYYAAEMGKPLFRRMMAFKPLIRQEDLAGIKVFTNALEQRCSAHEKRRINIDPGYLVLERFVLASGKNFSHRIYIGSGIYADLTLLYRKKAFVSLPWTYPDYADEHLQRFLHLVRNKYRLDLKTVSIPSKEKRNDA